MPATPARALGAGAADVAQIVPGGARASSGSGTACTRRPEQSRFRALRQRRDASSARRRGTQPLRARARRPALGRPASILLLGVLAPELRRVPVLIVGTYREHEMRRMPRRLGELARVERADLAARASTDGVLATSWPRRRRGAGGPRWSPTCSASRRAIRSSSPSWCACCAPRAGSTTSARAGDPAARRGARGVRRHLEPLSTDDRRLLTIAAVLGREFDLAAAADRVRAARDRLLERLASAREAGMVGEVRGQRSAATASAHALIRETLYGDLAPAARAQMHRRSAWRSKHGSVGDARHAARRARPPLLPCRAARRGRQGGDTPCARRRTRPSRSRYEDAIAHSSAALECWRSSRPTRRRDLALLHGARHRAASAAGGTAARARRRSPSGGARARAGRRRGAGAARRSASGSPRPEPGTVDATLVGLLEQALQALPPERERRSVRRSRDASRSRCTSRTEVARRDALEPLRAGAGALDR